MSLDKALLRVPCEVARAAYAARTGCDALATADMLSLDSGDSDLRIDVYDSTASAKLPSPRRRCDEAVQVKRPIFDQAVLDWLMNEAGSKQSGAGPAPEASNKVHMPGGVPGPAGRS
jgi:hypothetical protein